MLCRFGRLERGLEPINSLREVQKALDVPVSTVNRILQEFNDNDGRFNIAQRGRRARYVPQNIIDRILEPDRL